MAKASPQLPHYLRAHRKRLALSQDELAFLLGTESGARVCRYECFTREPTFRTALAYEAIFQRSGRELFAGLFRAMARKTAERAETLLRRLEQEKADCRVEQKRKALARIVAAHGTKRNARI